MPKWFDRKYFTYLSWTSAFGFPLETSSWPYSASWMLLWEWDGSQSFSKCSSGLISEATSSLSTDKSSEKKKKKLSLDLICKKAKKTMRKIQSRFPLFLKWKTATLKRKTLIHSVWESLKKSHLNFSISVFCPYLNWAVWLHCLTASKISQNC